MLTVISKKNTATIDEILLDIVNECDFENIDFGSVEADDIRVINIKNDLLKQIDIKKRKPDEINRNETNKKNSKNDYSTFPLEELIKLKQHVAVTDGYEDIEDEQMIRRFAKYYAAGHNVLQVGGARTQYYKLVRTRQNKEHIKKLNATGDEYQLVFQHLPDYDREKVETIIRNAFSHIIEIILTHFKNELITYCESDVDILNKGFLTFRELVIK
jgi:hypothetical protein